jgi:peroxiredoxin family protein
MQFSKDFEPYAGPAMELMQAKHVPHWMQTLQEAIEIGDVEIKACGMTMDLFGMKLTDLEPVVSEVTGVANFIEQAEGGTTLFI